MIPAVVALPAAAAVVTSYLVIRVLAQRPRAVRPVRATPDLRDEPPAVVNLLVNRLVDAPHVASATLLDLAARRAVEIHEVADGPSHTLVRLREGVAGDVRAAGDPRAANDPRAAGDPRPAYEARVLDRVARIAGHRLTPVTELVERHAEGGYHWQRRLTRDAVLDARRRGLISRTERGCLPALLVTGLAAALLLAPLLPALDSPRFTGVAVLLAVPWALLTLTGGFLLSSVTVGEAASRPDRYTAKGRRVTAHWLGVAEWLRGYESMRDLPPAAVAIWDRYLAYGVALDVMQHAVRVLDFERVGDRDVLVSTHTGRPRDVRVRYWRRRPVGRVAGLVSAPARLWWAVLTLPVWLGIGVVALVAVETAYARGLLLAFAVVQAARAGYRLVRATLDVVRPARVEGTVLYVDVANVQHSADDGQAAGVDVPDLPTHYFVVVDDGSSDEVRAWVVNRDIARGHPVGPPPMDPRALAAWHEDLVRPFFQPGDRVRLVGQPWSRFVVALEPDVRASMIRAK